MKIIRLIIAWLFLIYGLIGVLAIPVLYYFGIAQEMFSGINVYKVPSNILGGLAAAFGGILAIKNERKSLIYIGISIIFYVVGASYEIVLEYGLQFHRHIMTDYFESVAVQVILFVILAFCFRKNNNTLNT